MDKKDCTLLLEVGVTIFLSLSRLERVILSWNVKKIKMADAVAGKWLRQILSPFIPWKLCYKIFHDINWQHNLLL